MKLRSIGAGLLVLASGAASATNAFVTTTYEFSALGPAGGGGPAVPSGGLVVASDGNLYGTSLKGGAYGNATAEAGGLGTVYRVTTSGTGSVLYSFGASAGDGTQPRADLFEVDGVLYGTTLAGGAHGAGTVFKVSLGGTYASLYSFGASTTDGTGPAVLSPAPLGDLYGVTQGGGTHAGRGTAFRIASDGAYTQLYSFGATSTDGAAPVHLRIAGDGNFYGLTAGGGAYGRGTFFRMTPAGAVTTLYSFGGCSDDAAVPLDLAEADDGTFYGVSQDGGTHKQGTIFVVSKTGVLTVIHRFATADNGGELLPSGAPVTGPDGNFFALTQRGGAGHAASGGDGTIYEVKPNGAMTVLHSFTGSDPATGDQPSFRLRRNGANFYGVTQRGGAAGTGRIFFAQITGTTQNGPPTRTATCAPATVGDTGTAASGGGGALGAASLLAIALAWLLRRRQGFSVRPSRAREG